MALTDNLVHYYKFDDANDSVGSLNLTAQGTVTYTSGLIGNAATVVTGGYLKATTQPMTYTQAGTAFSTNGWIKFTSTIAADTNHFTCWFRCTDTTNIYQFGSGYDGAGGVWSFNMFPNSGGGTTATTYTNTPSQNTWYMLTTVYDGSTLSMYLNGSAVGTPASLTKGTFALNSQRIDVSGNEANGANQQVDEMGIWTRVLTTGEITSLYNGGVGLQYPFSTQTAARKALLGVGV